MPVSALPSGVVTFLFTDIEGSTRLWESAPESMDAALRRHNELVRAAIEGEGGAIFNTVGDEFCAAFGSPFSALTAAERVQRSLAAETFPADAVIKVRVALHTGWSEVHEGDYLGPVVNMTARLSAAAHGGQVVCSEATADLLGTKAKGASLNDLGLHELAGFDAPVRILQIDFENLPRDFPPLRAPRLAARLTNLPAERSSFVGRHVAVEELATLLRANRLVTVTGPGGVGKSRLAREVARRAVSEFPDGAWLVELAGASLVSSVASAILVQLGIEGGGRDDLSTLVDTLRDQHRLIVLDNCEHVLDECASLCDRITRECAAVRLLATSRQSLRVEGEQLYRLPPLSLPSEDVDDLEDLDGSDAVTLFVERAASQNPGFRLRQEDASIVAAICRRLDGIPLALELATARLGADSLEQLDRRLDKRFRVLNRGQAAALPHQQTLLALIDWSYDQLSGPERLVFERLCVFRGGFDLDAAASACALDDLDADDVADLVASLVEKSLVLADVDRRTPRYSLLESLRQYGLERLAAANDAEPLTRRLAAAHASYFVELYDEVATHLAESTVQEWIARGREEQENLHSACEELLRGPAASTDSATIALRTLGSVATYAEFLADYRVLCRLIDESLAMAANASEVERACAWYCKARALLHRDEAAVVDSLEEAISAARAGGDRGTEISATAFLAAKRGDPNLAGVAVSMAREFATPRILAIALNRLGTICVNAGDVAEGEATLRESLAISERIDDVELQMLNRIVLSASSLGSPTPLEARPHLECLERLFQRSAPPVTMTCAYLTNLGWLELAEGDAASASTRFRTALRRARLTGTIRVVPDAILGLACCASAEGESLRAAALHGAADAAIDELARAWDIAESSRRENDLERLRSTLGDDLDEAYARHRALALQEAVAVALGFARGDGPGGPPEG